jgi:hypothetical protein
MSDTFQFDYDIFYKYYINNSNIQNFNKQQPIAYFYVKNKKTNKIELSQDILSKKYIKINDVNVHIKRIGENELLFSIPKKINNILWDDHFHFGKDDNYTSYSKRNKDIHSVVFFHKTIQIPEENNKKTTGCYYNPLTEIELNNFENMECIQRGNKMRELYTPEDFVYIKEIISRPFLDKKVSTAGKSRKTRRNRKRRIRKTNRFIQKKEK